MFTRKQGPFIVLPGKSVVGQRILRGQFRPGAAKLKRPTTTTEPFPLSSRSSSDPNRAPAQQPLRLFH